MKYPGFVNGSYTSQSPNADGERTMNLIPEQIEVPNGKSRTVLYGAPGFELFTTIPNSPGRCSFAQDGRMFVVEGAGFYEVFSDGTSTLWGAVAIDANPATICSSGQAGGELFITSGDQGYVYDLNSNVFTNPVHDVTQGAFLDGYFLALDAATATLKLSDLLDGNTWDPTQVAQRNTGSDKWVGMFVANRLVYLIGSETAEVWYDAGTSPFPLEAIQEAFMEEGGTCAAFSAVRGMKGPIWLNKNPKGQGVVVRIDGYETKRISTHAVEFAMQGYSTITDAQAFSYQDQGHSFYVLTFPTANATWVFDETTELWAQRGFYDQGGNEFDAYRPSSHCYAFGKHLVSDRLSGAIYEMAVDKYADFDGVELRRVRRGPHICEELKRIVHDSFELDCEVGLGLTTGQGSDPRAMLSWSDDGGKTWSNEHWTTMGAIGKYKTRVRWSRLGLARDRVYELAFTDPVPIRLTEAYINGRGGAS